MCNAGACALAHAVAPHSSLQHIDLSACNIGSRGCSAVARALVRHVGLQVCPPAAALSFTARSQCTSAFTLLQFIDLSDSIIENGCCADLAEVLKGMRALQYINLSDTRVTQAGARALAAALQPHAQLQHLSLSGCSIGTRLSLPPCSLSASLNFTRSHTGKAAAVTLLFCVSAHAGLTHVDLDLKPSALVKSAEWATVFPPIHSDVSDAWFSTLRYLRKRRLSTLMAACVRFNNSHVAMSSPIPALPLYLYPPLFPPPPTFHPPSLSHAQRLWLLCRSARARWFVAVVMLGGGQEPLASSNHTPSSLRTQQRQCSALWGWLTRASVVDSLMNK